MSIDAKDVLALLPSAFEGAKMLVGLVSQRGASAVGLAQELTAFIIDAEAKGSSEEAIVEGVNDLAVQFVKRLKFGG